MINSIQVSSPYGSLSVFENKGQIVSLDWGSKAQGDLSDVLIETREQLKAYFNGRLRTFDLPLVVNGSDFQKAVCLLIMRIPYGETWTALGYG